ncbi:hypothetical protein TNCV_1377131 [Trichonephila clavipes]|nr:hypothetical protein TNCV_1377131 [Trichonephila clavipes]
MDPQPRNLAQLATALESAWLNIPENSFRDLSDSLPARLAAVHSAKEKSIGSRTHQAWSPKSPKWSQNSPNWSPPPIWSPKIMPIWIHRQDFPVPIESSSKEAVLMVNVTILT